jgi:hypothetical protein
MLCTAYTSSLPSQDDVPDDVPSRSRMVTIWPMDGKLPDAARRTPDCKTALDHYSLFSGQSAIRDASRQGQNMDGQGPFLIGWAPSGSRYLPDAVVLVVDMSGLRSQASFDEALMFWQRKVIEDPSMWQAGFSSERLRLAIRDFVDRYGTDIVQAIRINR